MIYDIEGIADKSAQVLKYYISINNLQLDICIVRRCTQAQVCISFPEQRVILLLFFPAAPNDYFFHYITHSCQCIT